MRKINIFEIEIANITMQQALESIADKIEMKEKSTMHFCQCRLSKQSLAK